MASRRSSAEIINATLVEVFLAFLFVVLALAWATDGQLKAEQKKTDQLRNENEASKSATAKAQAERDAAKAEKDKLEERFWSQFRPACKTPRPELRHFLMVTLAGPDQVVAKVQFELLSHQTGRVTDSSLEQFKAIFADVVRHASNNKCKYRILIHDTDRISKADFKRAIAVMKERFYIAGETR